MVRAGTDLDRGLDRYSAFAIVPLPVLAIYLTAADLYHALVARAPAVTLLFLGGPLVIGGLTLVMIVRSAGRGG